MLVRVKVEYISSYNEEGAFKKETPEFLLRVGTFCDAEKAVTQIIKDRYYPKEESPIIVTSISSYGVEPDMNTTHPENDADEFKWFEIHLKVKSYTEKGKVTYKVYKYLKNAQNVTVAEKNILKEINAGSLFDEYKVIKVIEMPFIEVIA